MFDEKKPTEEKVEEKKKGLLGKIKEATDDKEEQLAILSTFVRLGILIWSGGIHTLAYVDRLSDNDRGFHHSSPSD